MEILGNVNTNQCWETKKSGQDEKQNIAAGIQNQTTPSCFFIKEEVGRSAADRLFSMQPAATYTQPEGAAQ